MGAAQPAVGERENQAGTAPRRELCPGALGECLEEPLRGVGLHLGCGGKLWDGWTNVDVVGSPDVTSDLRVLPFEDGHADVIVSIHALEHFYYWDVPPMLTEWKRVLKPGGSLVLELPCMDKILCYMAECLKRGQPMDPQMTWLAIWGDPRYQRQEMCHKWGYLKSQLTDLLSQLGFVNIEVQKPKYHVVNRDMRVVASKPVEAA